MTPRRALVLIRHAQSEWNAAGRWQGHGDPPLSALGRRQAQALAEELAGGGIEVLVASDLARAAETAAILGARIGLVPRLDPRVRELDVGTWTGLTRGQIAARDAEALARFEAGESDAPAGGAETRRRLQRRVGPVAAELVAAHPGRRVALVTHLGVVRALLPGTELGNADWCEAGLDDVAAPSLRPSARSPRPKCVA